MDIPSKASISNLSINLSQQAARGGSGVTVGLSWSTDLF